MIGMIDIIVIIVIIGIIGIIGNIGIIGILSVGQRQHQRHPTTQLIHPVQTRSTSSCRHLCGLVWSGVLAAVSLP